MNRAGERPRGRMRGARRVTSGSAIGSVGCGLEGLPKEKRSRRWWWRFTTWHRCAAARGGELRLWPDESTPLSTYLWSPRSRDRPLRQPASRGATARSRRWEKVKVFRGSCSPTSSSLLNTTPIPPLLNLNPAEKVGTARNARPAAGITAGPDLFLTNTEPNRAPPQHTC